MTFLIQQTLLFAVPLMIVALAGVFAERSGIINLALEGIMIFGAFVGVYFVRSVQQAGWFAQAKADGNWLALQGFALLAMLVAACGGSNAEAISTDNGGKIMQSENKTNSSKALVVYYSRSGNTEALARMIGNETGADMFRVTTVTPYPEVYRETTELARAERDNNARPAINGRVENMADYDVVYIGVPNWWSTMPMPMFTFLEQYDLSGKIIVPFVTHGGGGVANCVSDLKKAVPGATVLDALVVSGGNAQNAQSDVSAWLKRLGLVK